MPGSRTRTSLIDPDKVFLSSFITSIKSLACRFSGTSSGSLNVQQYTQSLAESGLAQTALFTESAGHHHSNGHGFPMQKLLIAGFLRWLEQHCDDIADREPEKLATMIERSVSNKAKVVTRDEREQGIRALLNFGHSFAHALETLTGYEQFLHGEAVAIGMMVASRLSEQRGLCKSGFSERLGVLLDRFKLPLDVPENLHANDFIDVMKLDKKTLSGSIRLVLVREPGIGFVDSTTDRQQIQTAIRSSQSNPAQTF